MATVTFHAFRATVEIPVAVAFAPSATVFAAVDAVLASIIIFLILSIKILSLFNTFAIAVTPLTKLIALCTFSIACCTFSSSIPKRPIAPVTRDAPPATNCNACADASKFIVSLAKAATAWFASPIASDISPACWVIVLNKSFLSRPCIFISPNNALTCRNCRLRGIDESFILSNSFFIRSNFAAFFSVSDNSALTPCIVLLKSS